MPERGKKIAQHREHDCLVVNDQDSLHHGVHVHDRLPGGLNYYWRLAAAGGLRLGPCKRSSGG
jgi:hypothetical protein